jgi:hypothetical protein
MSDLAQLRLLAAQLDERLAERSSIEPDDAALPSADAETAAQLMKTFAHQVGGPWPTSVEPPLLIECLHCLSCLAALSAAACAAMLGEWPTAEGTTTAVALAVQAASPADPAALALPVRVQHLALMLLVNLSVSPEGGKLVDKGHRDSLEGWAVGLEDPRSRSLTRCLLDNIAQHSGIVHHITRRAAPGKLQLIAPQRMLAAFGKLEQVSAPAILGRVMSGQL